MATRGIISLLNSSKFKFLSSKTHKLLQCRTLSVCVLCRNKNGLVFNSDNLGNSILKCNIKFLINRITSFF